MFTRETSALSCSLAYMRTNQEVQRLQQAQVLVRQQLADKGLRLDEALQSVAAVKAELREIVEDAIAVGVTEVEAARLAGVARSTVREWLGKKT